MFNVCIFWFQINSVHSDKWKQLAFTNASSSTRQWKWGCVLESSTSCGSTPWWPTPTSVPCALLVTMSSTPGAPAICTTSVWPVLRAPTSGATPQQLCPVPPVIKYSQWFILQGGVGNGNLAIQRSMQLCFIPSVIKCCLAMVYIWGGTWTRE